MQSSPILRTESPSDAIQITEVHNLAFGAPGESELVRLIRLSDAFLPELSIVAELDGRIVGHVLFSKIKLVEDGTDRGSLSLAPVAVLPALQKKGIGARLIKEGIRRAEQLGFSSILVLGDPQYYPRFGFKHELTAKIESKYSCKAYMGLELNEGALSMMNQAIVNYPDAFSAVDC